MDGVIAVVRDRVKNTLLDVDEQSRTLGELVTRVRAGHGGSAIVYGQRESGRSALVQKVLEEYGGNVETKTMWLARFGTDTNALQSLVEREVTKTPQVLVVEAADDLVCKSRQALLYRLLDRTKTMPWLVLLIISRQDMISSLEKRVRSRLSNTRVFLGEAATELQYEQAMWRLLIGEESDRAAEDGVKAVEENGKVKEKGTKTKKGRKTKKIVVEEKENERMEVDEGTVNLQSETHAWRAFIDRFTRHPDTVHARTVLFEYGGTFAVLKRALDAWLVMLDTKMISDDDKDSLDAAIDVWRDAVSATVPVHSVLLPIVESLSHRTLCVLVAVGRRFRTNPSGVFSYGKIAIDFLHQCNRVDKRMLPPSELTTFKELDLLCELGIIARVGSSDSHSFRQVAAACSLQSLLHCIEECIKTFLALKDWYHTQPEC